MERNEASKKYLNATVQRESRQKERGGRSNMPLGFLEAKHLGGGKIIFIIRV